MEVFIINFYAEKFDGSGDEGSQYVLVDAFKTYDAAMEYVKNQFIPSVTKETKGFIQTKKSTLEFYTSKMVLGLWEFLKKNTMNKSR